VDDEDVRNLARRQYAMGSSDDVEIDTDAVVSETDDGWWVAAWVWVYKPLEDEEDDGEA
jgi:hypothetical protein